MANISKINRRAEKEKQQAAKNRRELISAGLNRRDMIKMGLLTSAGLLIPMSGLSVRARTSAGLWVANFGSSNVMKLSTDGMLASTYKTGDGPVSAVFSQGVVYIVNNGGDSVTKLSASDGANLGTLAVGRGPIGVAVSGTNVWVTNSGGNSVSKR